MLCTCLYGVWVWVLYIPWYNCYHILHSSISCFLISQEMSFSCPSLSVFVFSSCAQTERMTYMYIHYSHGKFYYKLLSLKYLLSTKNLCYCSTTILYTKTEKYKSAYVCKSKCASPKVCAKVHMCASPKVQECICVHICKSAYVCKCICVQVHICASNHTSSAWGWNTVSKKVIKSIFLSAWLVKLVHNVSVLIHTETIMDFLYFYYLMDENDLSMKIFQTVVVFFSRRSIHNLCPSSHAIILTFWVR